MKRTISFTLSLLIILSCFGFSGLWANAEPADHVHDYTGAVWHTNGDGTHYRYCTICGAAGKQTADCSYTVEQHAATCTENAYSIYTCPDCGDTYTMTFAGTAMGHAYNAVVTPATCTDDAYITYTCSRCGDMYVRTEADTALGHLYAETYIDATCEADAYSTFTCSRCGDTYVTVHTGTRLTHSYTDVSVVAPTCTEEGYVKHTCIYCGDFYCDNYTAPRGHTYVGTLTEATCTQDAYTTYVCSDCGAAYTVNYDGTAAGHIDEDDDGFCDVCGADMRSVFRRFLNFLQNYFFALIDDIFASLRSLTAGQSQA